MWRQFWSGPAGGREVLSVAMPMVISSLSWTVMTFVDRMMMRWVSGDAMTAAFQANLVWFSSLCLPLGIASYANAFVSQYYGDGQNKQIGPAVWQAIWFSVLCIPIMALGVLIAPWIFSVAGHSPAVQPLEVIYFQALCWGSGGMLISQAASAFFSGRGQTQVLMWVEWTFAIVNLVLDYLWIFGIWGFPEMGIAGAGLATAVSLWLKAVTYLVLMLRPAYRTEFATSVFAWNKQLFQRLMKFGGPSGVQMFLDVIGFTLFVMLMGRLGSVETEATSMAFSISSFAFMPIWGIGLTAGILVGQRLGENREDLAERAAWTSLLLGLAYMLGMSLLYWTVPDLFLSGFFAVSNAENADNALSSRQLAATLLKFVAIYNLFDAMFTILAAVVKGAGDTRFVMWVSMIMAAVLAAGAYVVIEVLGWGAFGCWTLVTLWIFALGLVFLSRFRGGKWKGMRVIEMQGTH